MSECTHDCSTCSSNCSQRDKKSFIEKPHDMSNIKKVIAVVSGKGGVGKSMVTSMMTVAMTLAVQVPSMNLQVALMVITIYGVIGLLTPSGSVNGAMIHAHEYTTTKSAYIAGAIMMVFLIIVMALVVIPMGMKLMV